ASRFAHHVSRFTSHASRDVPNVPSCHGCHGLPRLVPRVESDKTIDFIGLPRVPRPFTPLGVGAPSRWFRKAERRKQCWHYDCRQTRSCISAPPVCASPEWLRGQTRKPETGLGATPWKPVLSAQLQLHLIALNCTSLRGG